MRTAGLVARRARAQAGSLAMLVVLVATIAAICAGTVGSTRAAAVATVRSSLSEAGPTGAGLQVQTRLADDPGSQDAAVRAVLAELLPGIDLDVVRTLRSEPFASAVDGEEVRLVAGTAGDVEAGVDVVAGTAPGPGEGLLPEPVAAELGLAPGDAVDVEGTPVTVTGTWRPADPDAGAWFADPLVTTGTDGTALGPLLLDEATLTGLVDAPFVRWTVHPEVASLTREDLPVLAAGSDRVEAVLAGDDAVAVRGLVVTGELTETVAAIGAATSAASAVGLAPVVLLAVISLVALVQVARLLGQVRAQEVEIVVARGAAPRQVTGWAAAEALAVAALGAGAGTAVAAAVVAPLDGGAAQLGTVAATGALVGLAALGVASGVAGAQARAAARRLVTDRSGRAREAATLATVVLVAAAALLATWQLRRFGTPLVPGEDGRVEADALAVAALAAALTALAMIGLALLGPLLRAGEHLASHGRALAVPLAARGVSRRLRAYAVPVVLLALAAGATTTAGAFAGTSATQREQVAALATGSDVRVHLPARSASRLGFPAADSAVPYARLDGVEAAATVLRQGATLGETAVALTALPADRTADVVRAPEDLGLADAAARLVPADGNVRAGIALPAGAATVELDMRVRAEIPPETVEAHAEQAEAFAEVLRSQGATAEEIAAAVEQRRQAAYGDQQFPLTTGMWVSDADGALSLLEAGTRTVHPLTAGAADVGPEPTEHTLTAELPGAGDHRLVGLEVIGEVEGMEYELDYEVVEVRARGAAGAGAGADGGTGTGTGAGVALDGPPWTVVEDLTAGLVEPQPLGTLGLTARVSPVEAGASGRVLVRLLPDAAIPAVPAVLTTALATGTDLAVGDQVPLAVSGAEVDLEVVAILDAVPGGLEEHAVLVDSGVLGAHLLHERPDVPLPTQVWLAVDDEVLASGGAPGVGAAARDVVGTDGEVEVAGADVVDSTRPVREAFWLAAAGSAVLALTGAAAVALALARERRSEVMVLRALGQSPHLQARTRAGELLAVGVLGLALGGAAGWAVSALLVPTLARAAATATTPLPLGLVFEVAPAAVLLAVVLAGLLAVAVVVAARVRAQALDAEYREEVR